MVVLPVQLEQEQAVMVVVVVMERILHLIPVLYSVALQVVLVVFLYLPILTGYL
jgi:hypothetical protein